MGSVWREVEGTLATLPAEVHGGQDIAPAGVTDELAQRRAQRARRLNGRQLCWHSQTSRAGESRCTATAEAAEGASAPSNSQAQVPHG